MSGHAAEWTRLKGTFAELVDLPAADRVRRLDAIALSDPTLADRLARLLDADARAGESLARFELIPVEDPDGDPPGEGLPAADPLGIAGTTIGSFRVDGVLGSGGMGVAYRAEDTRLGRAVALKFMLPRHASDPEASRRFLEEARAASALDHPNVCTVLEVGESAAGPFLAMPAYPGETLRDRLAGDGALPPDTAVDFARQILRGLEAAHAAGITHRDLKPGNLIVTPEGVVKILDFGLAQGRDPTDARSGLRGGTIAYMSPEQLQGEMTGPATDLWSLGVVLHEMLTGSRPFGGGHDLAAIYAIVRDDPAPPSARIPDLPPYLDGVVARLLRKDPAERFGSATAALEALSPTEPARVEARRPRPPAARASRWVAAAVVALLSTLAGARFLTRSSADPPAAGPPTIAVLPFVDASPSADQAHLAEGVAEEILNALIHVPGLRVPGRWSSFAFENTDTPAREIALRLGVDCVLEGTVYRDGERVRITTRLLETRTDRYVWSQTFERGVHEIFEVQSEIAAAVARALELHLDVATPARRRTPDPVAYEEYLRGQFHWNRRTRQDLRHAIDFFTQATERDAGFARAWAGLALAYAVLVPLDPESAGLLPLAHDAAEHALALDSTLAEAHAARGYAFHWQWRWNEADRALRRALALDSTYATAYEWYGEHLAKMGRGREGVELVRKAIALDPLSLVAQNDLGIVLMLDGRVDEAIAQLEHVRSTEPGFALPSLLLHRLYLMAGQPEQAAEAGRRWSEMTGSQDGADLQLLARASADTTLRATAGAVLDEWSSRLEPQWPDIARYANLIGDRERAIHALERGFQAHSPMMAQLRVAGWIDPLRDDPRVAEILRRMAFPEAAESPVKRTGST